MTGHQPSGSVGHRGRRSVALVALLVLAVACDDGTTAEPPTSTEAPRPDSGAYGVALATVLDDPPPADGEDRIVVYLVPLDESRDIDTQAALIDRFADAYDIRFVDDLAAAIDDGEPQQPPRDDAIVIGVGTITSEAPHLLRLERYRASDEVEASLLTLEPHADGWSVVEVEPVTPEVLVDVP